MYGQHDASWLAFYDFFQEVCGLGEETDKLDGLWLLARSAGWALPHQNICWVSERHNILNRDERGRLHCENGVALAYPDGWSIYAWHGVRVTQDLIEKPIAVSQIEKETNAEIRRVMLERYGFENYLRDSGATLIHKDEFGELYRKPMPNEPLLMVRVWNATSQPDGTKKEYVLPVHPQLCPMTVDQNNRTVYGKAQELTALNAVASTYGLRGEEYVVDTRT